MPRYGVNRLVLKYPTLQPTRLVMMDVLKSVRFGDIEKFRYISQFVPDGVFTTEEALGALYSGLYERSKKLSDDPRFKKDQEELMQISDALENKQPFITYAGHRIEVHY